MNIIYPTNQEMDQAICDICDKALKKPTNLVTFIHDMLYNPGMKYIFYGVYDAVIVSFFVVFFAGLQVRNTILSSPMSEAWLYAGVFALAPLLTMLLFSLTFWKEREISLYAQKMTCRYTVAHLLTFRMLVASALGFVFTTGYVLVVCYLSQAPFLEVLSVAYASLFLFSIIMTYVVLEKGTSLSLILLNLSWILVNALGCVVSVDIYAELLRSVPTLLWCMIDLTLGFFIIRKFSVYVRRGCNAYS